MTNYLFCTFGKELQKYWDKRYEYFSKFDEGIQIDREGLYSVTPEAIATDQAKRIGGKTIFDGFGDAGGSAIAMALSGKNVISSELNSSRLAIAKNNANVYRVGMSISFIEGDFFEVCKNITADTVHLDPPWGGIHYDTSKPFLLSDFSPDGNKLLECCIPRFSEIVLKVPRTFDMNEIDRYSGNYYVHDDLLFGHVVCRTVYITT